MSLVESGILNRSPHWLQTPAAAVVLGLVLLLDACTLPKTTWMGRLLPDISAPTTGCYVGPFIGVYRTQSGIVVTDAKVSDWPLTSIFYRPRVSYEGIWAATSRVVRREPTFDTSAMTPQELPEVYAQFADYLTSSRAGRHAADAPLVRGGPSKQNTVLWQGYAHNAISALLAAGWLVSLTALTQQGWRGYQDRRQFARLSRGQCPRCNYELRGLPGASSLRAVRCPECGWSDATSSDE